MARGVAVLFEHYSFFRAVNHRIGRCLSVVYRLEVVAQALIEARCIGFDVFRPDDFHGFEYRARAGTEAERYYKKYH